MKSNDFNVATQSSVNDTSTHNPNSWGFVDKPQDISQQSAHSLRDDLASRGIWLGISGVDDLRVTAPTGSLTPELRQTLTNHKTDLLTSLKTGWATKAEQLISACPFQEVRDQLTEFFAGTVGAATTVGGMDQDDAERDSFGRLLVHLSQCQIGARDG